MSRNKKVSAESAPVIEKKAPAKLARREFVKTATEPIPSDQIIAKKKYDGYTVVVTKKGQKFRIND